MHGLIMRARDLQASKISTQYLEITISTNRYTHRNFQSAISDTPEPIRTPSI